MGKKNYYKTGLRFRKEYFPMTTRALMENSERKYGKRIMNCFSDGTGGYTYSKFMDTCELQSTRLSRYGIGAGSKVAILSQNMPNWTVAFFTATAYGRVAIPILPDSSPNEIDNILEHSESKAIFISKRLLPHLSEKSRNALTLVIDIETFEYIKKDDEDFKCDGWVTIPTPDSLATIIYTSGTTGKAKGVMLSHRNLCTNVMESYKAHKCTKHDRFLSILPMAHTYEMSISCIYPIYVGATVYYIQKPPTPSVLLPVIKHVRPTVMCVVPLIIEKIYRNSVLPTVKKSKVLTWLREKMPWLFYKLLGIKLYNTFGGKLKFFGIGGSKLDVTVEEFLKKCHFPYAIGYGLTECAPLVCNAMVKWTRVGSIGIASYKVDVRLDNVNPETGEGEIVCRGDNVMMGYYKDPDRTKQVINDEGWFRTNDVAVMDKDGFFYIKGRLNNTILGPSGENIYPEEIEQVINEMDGVTESLVIEKDGRLVALVKFDDNVLDWDQEFEDKFFESLEAKKKSILDFVNKAVGKNSKISDVEAMKEPFEKTATQKIRRFIYKDGAPKSKKD